MEYEKGAVHVYFHGDEVCLDFECEREHEIKPMIGITVIV